MTASLLLSTDEIPPRERGPLWCEWVWRHFGGLGSDLYGDSDFDGHIAASHAGDVILTLGAGDVFHGALAVGNKLAVIVGADCAHCLANGALECVEGPVLK